MKLADHTAHYRIDAEQFDYFEERSGADRDAARRIQEAVLSETRLQQEDVVLDLGSGNGWLLEEFDAKHSPRIVAVDLGMKNLRRLRERHGMRALVVAADAAHLPFRPGVFTAVIASEVLEHLNDPLQVLREAASCLAPGGRCVVSTPYREKLRYSLCIHCNRPTPANAHINSFDEHEHRRLFAAAQLSSVRYFTFQNTLLQYLRLSHLLRFLPWNLWRMIDRFANLLYSRCHSIVVSGIRKPDDVRLTSST
ncbi:MAG: methyltransferase domain-containing protein [Bacteroidetes bacterium]|nr:methyltransferase domain-containing protein [Bacteroidota bacterium]